MKFYSTPPLLSPTIHRLPLVVYHTFEVGVLDALIGVLLGLGQGTGQATPVLEYCYLQTTVVPFLRCVWGHCPIEKSSPPPPFPMFWSFPPPHPLILVCIHLSLNLYKLSHPIPPHTTPYHEVPKSQDYVIYWTKISEPWIMSASYTNAIIEKWANIRAVFWATVHHSIAFLQAYILWWHYTSVSSWVWKCLKRSVKNCFSNSAWNMYNVTKFYNLEESYII